MKTALAILIVLVLAAAGYFLFFQKTQAPVQNPQTVETGTSAPLEATNPNAGAASGAAADRGLEQPTVTVTYTDSGFAPKSLDVAPGTTVTFVNSSSHGMWVASDVHPTHAAYDGTSLSQHCPAGDSFDSCKTVAAGARYSFTFDKAGTFAYHNHVRANDTGTVVVR